MTHEFFASLVVIFGSLTAYYLWHSRRAERERELYERRLESVEVIKGQQQDSK